MVNLSKRTLFISNFNMLNQSKKFFYRLTIFLFFGIILFVLLDNLAQSCHPTSGYRIREAIKNSNNIEAIAVGNSHSVAIDFEELRLNGFRIAEGGNDIFETEYQIKSLVPKLSNLKIVLLNISYFTFHSDNAALPKNYAYFDNVSYSELLRKYPDVEKFVIPEKYKTYVLINTENIGAIEKNKLGQAYIEIKNRFLERSSIREELYNSFNNFNWIKGDFKNFIMSKLSRLVRRDNWRKIFTSVLISNTNDSSKIFDKYGQGTASRFFEHMSADTLCFTAKNIDVPRYLAVTKIMQKHNPTVFDHTFNSLVSIIKFLNKSNIRLVLYTPPYSECFNKYFDLEYIEVMNRKLLDVKQNYNIEYYNFSKDSLFSKENLLFYNSDHLNRRGANLFSQHFKKALNL